uniref:HTH La-type RNA-binding domain-containing protein n=1 Tax=Leersia perrieri TaxID=77586 RepID=A0A0D9W6Q7_9ORYZ
MAAAATSAASLDEAKAKDVLRQVEFYFSDSNLPRDAFLRKTVEESEDGLVSLALICSFSRMKKHLGLDADVKQENMPEETMLSVAEVLRRSSALRVTEDGKKVGRAIELSKLDEIIEQVDSRTIAAAPFPYNVKLEDVQSFFAEYGKVNSVRLPRHITDKRHFCGTALVEFAEEEEANAVLKNSLVFAGADLEIKPKKEFDAERETKKEAYEKAQPSRNGHDEGYPKGLIVAFKLKKIVADVSGAENGGEKVSDTDGANKAGTGNKEKIPENSVSEDLPDDVEKSKEAAPGEAAQSVNKGEGPSENADDPISREDIKEKFGKFGTVRFVDFSIGDDSGYIRFEDSKAAEKARAFAALSDEGGVIMKGHIFTLEPVSGQAEKDYWDAIKGGQGKFRDNRSNRGRDWKNNRGGRHFGGKRGRHSDGRDRASNKARKVDAAA